MIETPAEILSHAANQPPFLAGQAAWRNGKPLTSNPHKPAPFGVDNYPGLHQSWSDGWHYAKHMQQHTEALERGRGDAAAK